MKTDKLQGGELEYFYRSNVARKLDNVSAEFHRRLRDKLEQRGYAGLKLSFHAVLSNMVFSGTRLVDIAEINGMTKQTIGQIANEIEALGYIRRIPDPHDGRAKNLVLTARGEQLIHDSIEMVAEVKAEFAQLIGEDNIEQLGALLSELSDKITAASKQSLLK
jgi:DNA-binding MarR family transcriptional regulator